MLPYFLEYLIILRNRLLKCSFLSERRTDGLMINSSNVNSLRQQSETQDIGSFMHISTLFMPILKWGKVHLNIAEKEAEMWELRLLHDGCKKQPVSNMLS